MALASVRGQLSNATASIWELQDMVALLARQSESVAAQRCSLCAYGLRKHSLADGLRYVCDNEDSVCYECWIEENSTFACNRFKLKPPSVHDVPEVAALVDELNIALNAAWLLHGEDWAYTTIDGWLQALRESVQVIGSQSV